LNELGPDWNYPVHLGVTEAGEGEDARIKSAIGIGSLLADGIGETNPRLVDRRQPARDSGGASVGCDGGKQNVEAQGPNRTSNCRSIRFRISGGRRKQLSATACASAANN